MKKTQQRYRSKTAAAWLALLLGALGAHRFYLHGWRDAWGWVHWAPTLLGLVGVARMRNLGQDDRWAWLLIPLLGAALSAAALAAIVAALTPDARWDERYNAGLVPRDTAWGPVLAAVLALLVGGAILMGTVTFSVQMFFEWQLRPSLR